MKTEYNDGILRLIFPPSGDIEIPEVNLKLVSAPIVAKTRKLKCRWTPEMDQDLEYWHDLHDIEY